jgi:hypothetical protein
MMPGMGMTKAKAGSLLLLIAAAGSTLSAQCSDSNGPYFYVQSQASRKDGNTVKLYNQTTDWGDFSSYWRNYVSGAFFLNGVQQQTLLGSHPPSTALPLRPSSLLRFRPGVPDSTIRAPFTVRMRQSVTCR